MYSILHETDDATAVNLSVYGKFLSCFGRQLVTVGAKCLKFYRTNPFAQIETDHNWVETTRLECLMTFNLMAPVRAMGVARIPLYPECDSLIMSFDDAKLSIVNINPKTLGLNTLSLHSIEDDFLRDGYTKSTFSPDICIDPAQRCCAFLVYGRHLGIVPFAFDNKDQHLQSYTIPLVKFDERLDNILDMAFLEGYYEPTILFLYEPIKTTAGRACVRYDTVSILGVSLNLKDRVHATVWNFGGLPMTVDRCLAIPLPVGGVCLFGANEIIYLNQSVPPCGLALNSCADEYTKFPMNDMKSCQITLDGCAVALENLNTVFLVLRSGDFYVLTLDVDPTNAVKNLILKKCFETSIPCTLTICSPGYVFVGSRLGNSTLLQYTRKRITKGLDSLQIPNKLAKNSFSSSNHTIEEENKEDEEDLFLYSSNLTESVAKTKIAAPFQHEFSFRLLDSLENIGPCKILKCCAANDISSFYRKKPTDVFFNLVTASGHGKDASLCFFERTIRPDVITSSALLDAVQFWSVGRREDDSHKYLIIAREMTTMVLELGNDMVELEAPIFITSETTVQAGELATGSIAVQVTSMNIVLVANDTQLSVVNIKSNFPVSMAAIVDPFIVLLTQNGKILLYRLLSNPVIQLQEVQFRQKLKHEQYPITSICIYKDLSGIIQMCSSNPNSSDIMYGGMSYGGPRKSTAGEDFDHIKKEEASDDTNTDDIDDFLYGGEKKHSEKNSLEANLKNHRKRKIVNLNEEFEDWAPKLETNVMNPQYILPTFWLFLTRENGNLYIYSIPDNSLVYMIKKFNQLHEVLHDDESAKFGSGDEENTSSLGMSGPHSTNVAFLNSTQSTGENAKMVADSILVRPEEVIMELQIYGMGYNQSRPILAALIDDIVVFYEMFAYDNGIDEHLAIRFKRINCISVTRTSRFLGPNGRAPVQAARDLERHRPLIHTFDRLGKLLSGIFICGGYPSIFLLERGEAYIHPLTIDGPIASFTPFNNFNCPNGFLYLTKMDSMMRIALLQPDLIYDASYPFRKVPLKETVHFVVYLLNPNLYGVVTSQKKPNLKLCTVLNEDKQIESFEKEENFILPTLDYYNLRLFSTEDWNFVPNSQILMEEFEVITCCEEVLLSSESTMSGMQNYLAIGTAINYGEEVFVRGRIILCEIIEVVPEEGMPTSRHRLKTVYDKEQKGPVTSMCYCNGYLLTGMGQKVFIWQYKDNELNGVSFLDLHFYVHTLVGFRNLAVACDLYRSLSFIRYQEEFKALSLVSRDLRPNAPSPMATHFLVDHKQLGFLLTDEANNISVFNYLPELKESIGGERLILRAALNIGSMINSIVRVKGHIYDSNTQTTDTNVNNEEQIRETQTCLFATLDGSFGAIRPLNEKMFRRLHMLQQVMTLSVPQAAGLNPRGARAPRSGLTAPTARNIVDGFLVQQYLYLNTQDKTDLARKLGTSRYQIIDDLIEIKRAITHF